MALTASTPFTSQLVSGGLKGTSVPVANPGGNQSFNGGQYNYAGDPINQTAKNQYSTSLASIQKPAAAPNPAVTAANNNVTQNNQLLSMYQQILAAEKAQAPAVGQTLNINAIQSAAQSAAQNQVNPLYTQQLNEYLQNEATQQQEQQSQNQMNISGYQAGLQNTLAQNTQAQNYASQQNELTQGNINAQAGNYQLNSGNAESQKIQALQQSTGQGGLSGSGMGSQQLWEAENQKNVEDAQQQGGFQYNRDVANMTANNTFSQLAQSSAFAGTQEGEQEAQSNFNLNSYIRQSAAAQTQYQQALTAWQQSALSSATQNNEAQSISSQINNIANPGVRGATEQEYSGYLGSNAMPAQVSQSSYQPGNF